MKSLSRTFLTIYSLFLFSDFSPPANRGLNAGDVGHWEINLRVTYQLLVHVAFQHAARQIRNDMTMKIVCFRYFFVDWILFRSQFTAKICLCAAASESSITKSRAYCLHDSIALNFFRVRCLCVRVMASSMLLPPNSEYQCNIHIRTLFG